jgi:hypothetical protein
MLGGSNPGVDACFFASILRIPQMIWVWRWYIDRGNPKNSEKNLSQYHFVHHKSHMDWPGYKQLHIFRKSEFSLYETANNICHI